MNSSDARTPRPSGYWWPRPARISSLVLSLVAVVAAWPMPAGGAEPAEQFLSGLQERGMNELALHYLDRMQSSQLVDEEFRRQIPYHRGAVLIEQSRQTADPAVRSRLLYDARAALESYAEANSDSVQGAEAQLQLASVELSRGQQLRAQADQLPGEPAYDAQRQSLRSEARASFATARETFFQAEEIYAAELEKLSRGDSDAKNLDSSRRQKNRARVAQLRFLAAQTQFETAQSYPRDDEQFRELHKEAAQELEAVYDEFARTFIVGLYARLYEGRCYQAVGQYQQALGCFEDILAQPNVLPPFRKLIASAIHRKIEILLEQEKYDAAIDAANACLRDASGSERKLPEWLAVRFRLAEVLQKKAESAKTDSLEKRKLLTDARNEFRAVAATPGEFQTVARTAAATMTRDNDEERSQPRTFQAAYDAGKDALASYNAAKLAVPTAQRNNPVALPELEAQMEEGKRNARYYFRAATTLVDDDTDLKLLNEVRYFLCWLYWENEDYYRAAVLGEFLARRYSDHPAASSAAKLAMASYERLYSQAASDGHRQDDAEFEARRMAKVAEFVARRWPDSQDADAARSVLVGYAIRTNRIDEAEKLLAGSSPQSKAQLELQLGNAMWARYLELSQAAGSSPGEDDAVARLKSSAVKYLRSGFENARKERDISESAATAGLYLVQALLSDENYGEAIELLQDEQMGSLTLVSNKHPAASRPQFVIEAYKAALRAYVLSTPPQAQKAIEMMESLEDAVDKGGGNDAQLTQIYIGLSVALQKQLEQLRTAGRTKEAQQIADAFSQFLEKIAAHQADANWPTRVWVAQTYYNMGADQSPAVSAAAPRLSESARSQLTKSRDAYQQLIADAATNPGFAPNENSVLAAKVQLGECYRALGQYQQALDTLSEVLKQRESSLSVQRAAAMTYQQRGQAEGRQWLERAIHGGYKLRTTGQNRIWGWLKISQIAARAARADEKYHDTFYEARANIARCRYLAAMKQSGAAREQDLAKAKQSIQSLAQLYPDLGGQKWRGEFDALLRQIQSAAGEKPDGLREFSADQGQTISNERRG